MDCIYNRKPEDRYCDYCSVLCKNNPAYEYLKARKKANNTPRGAFGHPIYGKGFAKK